MSSRDRILGKLRAARRPFEAVPPVAERLHMAPVEDVSPAGLQARFVREAQALGCSVTVLDDPDAATARVLELIAPEQRIQSWEFAHIPLPGLPDALTRAGIAVVPGDTEVRTGLTGADAALAGTGSLVLVSGPGKPRQPSLVPPVHVAIITAGQIVPNLDTWIAAQRDESPNTWAASNISVISGPSRTGDIANIPVKRVHGPGEVHVILLAEQH